MKRILGVVVGGLVFAPSALAAGGSTLSGYGGSAGAVQGTVQKTGTLPFTGFSLLGVLVLAIALIAAGVLIRLRTRATD